MSEYTNIRDSWPAYLVAHFPASLPLDAANVRMSALPKFLQGGARLQIAYVLPVDQVRTLEADFRTQALAVYPGGDKYEYVNKDPAKGLPIVSYVTSGTQNHSFPVDFEVFVLDAKSHGGSNWNHGHTRGVSISTTRNEVVYWVENW